MQNAVLKTLMELTLVCAVVNSTISIGLTEPWDPASVTMKTTPKSGHIC